MNSTKAQVNKSFKLQSLVILLAFLSWGCATGYHNPHMQLSDESVYVSTLENFTEKQQIYDGFYQTLEFSASLLNSDVMKYQLDQNARIYQWTPEQYTSEKGKVESTLAKQTDVFLSFFTPERKNDNLNKPITKWKIFLDCNGKRYDGKVTKIKGEMAEILSLYPNHNRWSTPYKVTFPVSTSLIEHSATKMTITGPVGSAMIDFKSM